MNKSFSFLSWGTFTGNMQHETLIAVTATTTTTPATFISIVVDNIYLMHFTFTHTTANAHIQQQQQHQQHHTVSCRVAF